MIISRYLRRHGMSTLVNKPLAQQVSFSQYEMTVSLKDGRRIAVPLTWFPSLLEANQDQLDNHLIMGEGEGIHWPELDEDISVLGLLLGSGIDDGAA